jgi:hypothetical protein
VCGGWSLLGQIYRLAEKDPASARAFLDEYHDLLAHHPADERNVRNVAQPLKFRVEAAEAVAAR